MKINWFTVIAQVINFLILVWLMKRYLYKPVLNAIDEREKKIAAQLADAEAKKAEGCALPARLPVRRQKVDLPDKNSRQPWIYYDKRPVDWDKPQRV